MYGLEYASYLCYIMVTGLGVDIGLKFIMQGKNKVATSRMGKKSEYKKILGNDGIQLSKNYQLTQKYDYEGVCIIAPTGAGKTSSLFIPNLLQDNIKGSIIINDPKNELYRLTHKYQESIGRKVILFKPLEPGGTEYNLYKECKNIREVSQLAQSLLMNGTLSYEIMTGKKANDVDWIQKCQSLLTAALLYKNTNIQDALLFIINSDTDTIDKALSNANTEIRNQYNIFRTSLESPKTMSSIKITFACALTLFTDNLSINKTSFHAEDLRNTSIALYISYPENKSVYLSPFMSSFYTQFIDKLIDYYSVNKLPITFFLEEFGNIGQLNNFPLNAATGRSRKISFISCLQSITQLKQLYGENNALAILNNLKTKIVLPGLSDIPTLNYISDLCGFKEVKITNEKGNTSTTTKKLFTPEEVRCLDDDKALIITGNKYPVLDQQNVYYRNSKYQGGIV